MKQKAIDLLRSSNLRRTEPRIAILVAMLKADAPLTQEQIAEHIGGQPPNKTTIYRTLMNLVQKNLVHRVFVEERTWHFELAHHCSLHQCHPHFTCRRCLQTQCLTDVAVPLLQLPEGYTIHRQQIRIEGICSACRNKPKK
ncbi:MAG TPA: transcriptional repressor [Anaerohalosphaeraceae bacterium]|nr:transcriptional repressor [Phycisphaerae bacterium]HOK95354.1 transcriptional repressor [Anaerohalosphaeraceae bacterium]HOL31931.1 transcriptional repressor [Anaerohalosphaeraceae bacterium]HOM76442.1 transcriptional repressor [Anaerohalosphaeraceae bacterium]HPC64286.1 transcriptional repressor [Anaerohalosphaeraceae bacterium]